MLSLMKDEAQGADALVLVELMEAERRPSVCALKVYCVVKGFCFRGREGSTEGVWCCC